MPGKKRPVWKTMLLGLAVSMAVELIGVLMVTLLSLRGFTDKDVDFYVLAATALCAAFAGGLTTGKGKLGTIGALLNAALFASLLAIAGLGIWGMVSTRGLILAAILLLGGILAAVACGKVGKRRGKRLVKTNKKARFS